MKASFEIAKEQVVDFEKLRRDLRKLVVDHDYFVSDRKEGHYPFNSNQQVGLQLEHAAVIVTIEGERCALLEHLTPALIQVFAVHGLVGDSEVTPILYESSVQELLWNEDMCGLVARLGLESSLVRQGGMEAMGTCRFRDATDEGFPVVYAEPVMFHVHHWKQEAGKLIWGTLTPEQKLTHQALAEAYISA